MDCIQNNNLGATYIVWERCAVPLAGMCDTVARRCVIFAATGICWTPSICGGTENPKQKVSNQMRIDIEFHVQWNRLKQTHFAAFWRIHRHQWFSAAWAHSKWAVFRLQAHWSHANTTIQSTSLQRGMAQQLALSHASTNTNKNNENMSVLSSLRKLEKIVPNWTDYLRAITPSRPAVRNVFAHVFENMASTKRWADTDFPSVVCSSTSNGPPLLYCSATPLSHGLVAKRLLNLSVDKLLLSMLGSISCSFCLDAQGFLIAFALCTRPKSRLE